MVTGGRDAIKTVASRLSKRLCQEDRELPSLGVVCGNTMKVCVQHMLSKTSSAHICACWHDEQCRNGDAVEGCRVGGSGWVWETGVSKASWCGANPLSLAMTSSITRGHCFTHNRSHGFRLNHIYNPREMLHGLLTGQQRIGSIHPFQISAARSGRQTSVCRVPSAGSKPSAMGTAKKRATRVSRKTEAGVTGGGGGDDAAGAVDAR